MTTPPEPRTLVDVLGEAIDATFPILRELEPGEPEAFLGATTLLHELEKRGYTVAAISVAPDPSTLREATHLRSVMKGIAFDESVTSLDAARKVAGAALAASSGEATDG